LTEGTDWDADIGTFSTVCTLRGVTWSTLSIYGTYDRLTTYTYDDLALYSYDDLIGL
jgi:hypothetical protein